MSASRDFISHFELLRVSPSVRDIAAHFMPLAAEGETNMGLFAFDNVVSLEQGKVSDLGTQLFMPRDV